MLGLEFRLVPRVFERLYLLDNLARTDEGEARRGQGWITGVLGGNHAATPDEQVFQPPELGVSIDDRVPVILLTCSSRAANVSR